MQKWLKTTWYFFIILAAAQIAKTTLHIFVASWHPKVIDLSFNFILILTSFFISWQVYKHFNSILKSVISALVLLAIASTTVNILTALIIVKFYFPLLFQQVVNQIPIALQNGAIYAPMVILLAFIACRTQTRKENLKQSD